MSDTVLLALPAGVLLGAALFGGKGLLPADGVFLFPPWSALDARGASNPLLVDQFLGFLPLKHYFHSELSQGRFPLWNPSLACGVPLLASMQAALLYPIHLTLAWLDPFRAAGWAAFLKLWLAAVFMALYARRLGCGRAAAALAGLAYSLSGFFIVWLGHPHANAAVFLPALFFLIEEGLEGGARPWLLYAAAYACALLGGHAPTLAHMSLASFAYLLLRARGSPRGTARALGYWAAASLTGFLLASAQWWPYLEYLKESSAWASAEALQRWRSRSPGASLIHLFLPYLAGAPHLGFEYLGAVFGLESQANFNERTAYLGVLPLALALGALCRRLRGPALFHAACLVFSLCAAHGLWPLPKLFRLLPVLNSINPQRLLLLFCFSGSILAGLELEAWFSGSPPAKPWPWLFHLPCVLVSAWALSRLGPFLPKLSPQEASFLARQFALLAGGVLAVSALALLRGRLSPKALAFCALTWASADSLLFAWGVNPAIERSSYYPETPAIRFLKENARDSRVLGLGPVLPPNTATVYGFKDARGMDYMSSKRYEELLTGGSGSFFFYSIEESIPRAAPLLALEHAALSRGAPPPEAGWEKIFSGEIDVYRSPRRHPRALAVFSHQTLAKEAILRRLRGTPFDPAGTLLLEEEPVWPKTGGGAAGRDAPESASIHLKRETGDESIWELSMPKPGFFLLLDSYFPGWKAELDGKRAPLLRADYHFRAVPVPAGRWTLRLAYRPLSFRLGLLISLLSAAALAAAFLRAGPSRRPRPEGGPTSSGAEPEERAP